MSLSPRQAKRLRENFEAWKRGEMDQRVAETFAHAFLLFRRKSPPITAPDEAFRAGFRLAVALFLRDIVGGVKQQQIQGGASDESAKARKIDPRLLAAIKHEALAIRNPKGGTPYARHPEASTRWLAGKVAALVWRSTDKSVSSALKASTQGLPRRDYDWFLNLVRRRALKELNIK